jgi:hypothetical protein
MRKQAATEDARSRILLTPSRGAAAPSLAAALPTIPDEMPDAPDGCTLYIPGSALFSLASLLTSHSPVADTEARRAPGVRGAKLPGGTRQTDGARQSHA